MIFEDIIYVGKIIKMTDISDGIITGIICTMVMITLYLFFVSWADSMAKQWKEVET